jgi:hypothetical protein
MYSYPSQRDLILEHWNEHRPAAVVKLREANRLETEITVAEEKFTKGLHSLIQTGCDYKTAWVIMMNQSLPPEDV